MSLIKELVVAMYNGGCTLHCFASNFLIRQAGRRVSKQVGKQVDM